MASAVSFLQQDLDARERRIAVLEERLANAHREIGSKDWTIADLRHRLEEALQAVSELQQIATRAHTDEDE